MTMEVPGINDKRDLGPGSGIWTTRLPRANWPSMKKIIPQSI